MFTVSRWYAPANPGETGRIISLAKATLFDMGVSDPNKHIFLAATPRLSTVVVSRSPLSDADLGKLRGTSDRLAFDTLFSPGTQPTDPVIRVIYNAKTKADLFVKRDDIILDFSPPTDDRPFFFNQLRLDALEAAWSATVRYGSDLEGGVLTGNLVASLVLLIIVALSLAAVVLTIVIPALPVVRRAAPRLICFGTAYFLLIGLGFMFVEIGLMQRLSIFLGHPIYGLVIALAGIIMATGMGSALSECFRLDSPRTIMAWSILTFAYIVSLPAWFPDIVAAFDSSDILVRGAISLATIFPAGIALGIWFPTGMRLVQASDSRPTPWFWAVNGSAGVFASGVAVATGTFVSIDATLWVASICYALLCPVALLLLALNNGTKAAGVAS